jgi:hypothetical protein
VVNIFGSLKEILMISEKQLAANRLNATRSTGPRTPAGKAITRLNAVTHALTGQLTIVAPSDHAAFTGLSQRLAADLQPTGEQELQVAARLIRDTWRLARAAANEENIYALGFMDQANTEGNRDLVVTQTIDPHADPALTAAICNARTYLTHSRDFDRASLYEQRLKRGLVNDYKLFHQLQKNRMSVEKQNLAKPRPALATSASASNGSDFANSLQAPLGNPVDPKIEPQIITSTLQYVSPCPPPPPAPFLDPYWPC